MFLSPFYILIVLGLIIRYLINRAEFNRTNEVGVLMFKSYEHRTLFWLITLVGRALYILLIITGIGLACDDYKAKERLKKENIVKEKVEIHKKKRHN